MRFNQLASRKLPNFVIPNWFYWQHCPFPGALRAHAGYAVPPHDRYGPIPGSAISAGPSRRVAIRCVNVALCFCRPNNMLLWVNKSVYKNASFKSVPHKNPLRTMSHDSRDVARTIRETALTKYRLRKTQFYVQFCEADRWLNRY